MKKRISIVSLKMCKESSLLYEPRQIQSPDDCFNLITSLLENSDKEKFIVIALNTRNEPTRIEICSIGTTDRALISPRDVFKTALLSNATKIIVAHNHPSGDPKPSEADKNVTEALKEASVFLDIQIIDHIIVGDKAYFSFAKKGII